MRALPDWKVDSILRMTEEGVRRSVIAEALRISQASVIRYQLIFLELGLISSG